MATYRAVIDAPIPITDAFDYLSRFDSTAEWDPGVLEARRLDTGDVREGSAFRLLAGFLGRTVPLTYRIVEYEPPYAVGFLGENATVSSHDRITFEPGGEGTRIVYDADLALRGPLRLADPLLALAFKRVGDRALAGLRERLSAASSISPPPAEHL